MHVCPKVVSLLERCCVCPEVESVLEKYLAALKSYLRTGAILIVEEIQKRIGFLEEVSSFLSFSIT